MNPVAQAYLADRLAQIRDPVHPAQQQSPDGKRLAFSNFRAAVDALAFVGMVDHDEISEWTNRCLVALGEKPLEPLNPRPGVAVARLVGFGADPPESKPPVPRPTPELIRLVPTNTPALPTRHGGRFQLLGVEIYDTQVTVGWRFAPLPDNESLLGEGLAELDADTEGMPEDQRLAMRKQFLHRRHDAARMMIVITDDVGTEYRPMGGGASGGGDERIGRTTVAPAPPMGVTRLIVRWEDVEQVVALE